MRNISFFHRGHYKWLMGLLMMAFSLLSYATNAPDFSLPSTDSSTLKLSQFKGKVVLLDFWASWCGPCRQSFPWMNEMIARYGKDGLAVVAVNLDENRKDAEKFLQEVPANFNIAFNPQGNIPEAYHVQGMPTSYLVDRNGQLVGGHIGFNSSETEQFESEIVKLLKK